jgi:hypothetical protein
MPGPMGPPRFGPPGFGPRPRTRFLGVGTAQGEGAAQAVGAAQVTLSVSGIIIPERPVAEGVYGTTTDSPARC